MNKIILIVLVVIVLILGGALAFVLLKDNSATEQTSVQQEAVMQSAGPSHAPALYQPMAPAFVVNFENPKQAKFMQITVEVMARDQAVLDKVTNHDPKLRNNLILLFGSVSFDEVNSRAGKEALRQKALEEINRVLEEETGSGGVEEVLFTKLVMQ